MSMTSMAAGGRKAEKKNVLIAGKPGEEEA
jgi:hypothetical protein